MTKLEIGLVGVTGLQNRGVEALICPTLAGLQSNLPGCRISVATGSPDYDRLRCPAEGIEWIQDPFAASRVSRIARLKNRISTFVPPLGGVHQREMKAFGGVDGIIATGGDVYSSDYGSFAAHLEPIERVIEAGGKAVFLAQSIGPFRTKAEAEIFTSVACRADLVTLREQPSYRYCIEELGLPKSKVVLAADPGLLLEPDKEVEALQDLVGLHRGKPYVTVSLSRGISAYGRLPGGVHEKAWSRMVSTLLGKGYQVLLVAHVQRDGMREDDRIPVAEIGRALGWPAGLHLATADFSAGEFKALISGACFNLAERMHAAIAGLSTGVPTGVVSYSVKAEGILGGLYGAEEARSLMLPVADLADPKAGDRFLENLEENRAAYAELLAENLPGEKRAAANNFELIGSLFGGQQRRDTNV